MGFPLCVCTSKQRDFAVRVPDAFELTGFFSAMGIPLMDRRTFNKPPSFSPYRFISDLRPCVLRRIALAASTTLPGAVTRRGIPWPVVRTWRKKDRFFEQRLKRGFALNDLCPVCSGPSAHKRGR